MRIAMVGSGGVGGYFGGQLVRGGAEVTFIARGATLDALRTRGLRVDSIKGDFEIANVNATDDPASVGPVDAIFMAVKAWQIPEAARAIVPMIGPDTVIVPLENGMEAPRQLVDIVGERHVLGGLCGIVSFIVAPGHIRHAGAEPFIMFGELNGRRTERVARLQQTLVAAGVNADVPYDIRHAMWSKFLFIAPMSGIGAVARVPVGAWRNQPETRELAIRAIHELVEVAFRRGVKLDADAVEKTLARYDALPPESTSSLQRDLMDGKPSELEAQLGAAVRMAREAAVDAPVHETLYAALLPLERRSRGEI